VRGAIENTVTMGSPFQPGKMDATVHEMTKGPDYSCCQRRVNDWTAAESSPSTYGKRRRWFKARLNKPSATKLSMFEFEPHQQEINVLNTNALSINCFLGQYRLRRVWYKNQVQQNPLNGKPAEEGLLPVCLLLIVTVGGMCPWFAASAIVPALREMWGINDLQSSFLTIAVNCGFLCGALVSIFFRVADYYRPSNLITLGAVFAAVFNLCFVIPGVTFGDAICARFLTGAAMAFVYPMACKVCATWYALHRGKAIGVVIGAVVLGSACPHLINGGLSLHWAVLVVSVSACCFFAACLSFLFLREGPYYARLAKVKRAEIVDNKGRSNNVRSPPTLLHNQAFVLATLAYSGHNWELYSLWTWFSTFAASNGIGAALSFDAKRGGSLAAFLVISSGFFGSVGGGMFADKHGRTTVCIVSLALSVLCSMLTAWVSEGSIGAKLLYGTLWGVFSIAESAQYSAMVTEVVDPRRIGEATTLQFAIGYIFTIPTIYIVPLIKESMGWGWAWSSLSVGPMLSIVAIYCLRKAPEAIALAKRTGRMHF
jgi:MFS family permease